jgi:hypothetical protein
MSLKMFASLDRFASMLAWQNHSLHDRSLRGQILAHSEFKDLYGAANGLQVENDGTVTRCRGGGRQPHHCKLAIAAKRT